jgi:hypothetical protein
VCRARRHRAPEREALDQLAERAVDALDAITLLRVGDGRRVNLEAGDRLATHARHLGDDRGGDAELDAYCLIAHACVGQPPARRRRACHSMDVPAASASCMATMA